MADIRIRELTHDNIEAIMPLMIQLGYELNVADLQQRFGVIAAAGGHVIFGAEANGLLAGFCHAFVRPALEKPPEVVVQSLVVDSAARKSGIGKALMDKVEAWAAQQGFTSVSLYSQVERKDAHAFYESLGYEQVARSALMRKWLTG